MGQHPSLTLQAFWGGQWHDAADVTFTEPDQGLLSDGIRLSYRAEYVNQALDLRALPPGEHLQLTDERALSVNLPASFMGDYVGPPVAAFLRDIIPQGAGRRHLARHLGYPETVEQSADLPLLRAGCIAPIGNLRIREAADSFQQKLNTAGVQGFTGAEITDRADELIEHARHPNIAIGSTSGIGGDAPKLMITEATDGLFYLEGSCSDARATRHWIIKFPRGRRSSRDQDVLRGEAAVYRALASTKVRSIQKAQLVDSERGPALWLERFDRRKDEDEPLQRLGMESIYSLMGVRGDGASLSHNNVVRTLMARFKDDDMLVDYLVNDIINETIGNRDNHGRNIAFLKDQGKFRMAPAFDLAPMVLDPEGISRTCAWDNEWRIGTRGDYASVLQSIAIAPASAQDNMLEKLRSIANLRKRLNHSGAPAAMMEHPGFRPELPDTVIDELSGDGHAQSQPR